MRNLILPVLLSLSSRNAVARGVNSPPLSRHLMEDLLAKRHTHPIPDHSADPSYPKSIWSEFMLSPCRPEDSGHFGSTYGTPILLQYGFEMETSHYPNIEKALKVIDEKVMDALLSTFFPTICGFEGNQSMSRNLSRRKRLDAEITGFRFSKELIDMTRSCTPFMDEKDHYCGIFYSKVWVFGHKLHLAPGQVLREAIDAVNDSLLSVSNLGVVRLVASESLADQIQDGGLAHTGENMDEIEIGALSGLVISSLALIVGAAVLIVYIRTDRRTYQRVSRSSNSNHKICKKTVSRGSRMALSDDDDMTPTTWLGSFRYFSSNGTHIDEETEGDTESEISSVVVDPQRGTFRKMETGRRVTITFDPSCRSGSSTTGSDISSVAPEYLDADGRYSEFAET